MKPLIAVITCHTYQYPKHDEGAAHHSGFNLARSQAIRDTWYKTWEWYRDQIDLKFFYGRRTDILPGEDEVFLDCGDDYYSLPQKVQKMFEWAKNQGYDQVLKVDDDVFLYVDRLLQTLDNSEYRGFVTGTDNGLYISGTAYWLGKRAIDIVATAQWNPKDWAEDKTVGRWLAEKGIYPTHDERFQCCHCIDCAVKFPEVSRISTHTVDPKEMYARI